MCKRTPDTKMALLHGLITMVCIGAVASTVSTDTSDVLFRDDFSGQLLKKAWEVTYQSVSPGLQQMRGLLVVKHSTSWYLPSQRISVAKYPNGVRLSADLFFYPRPGFEWIQTGNPYPLGLQNETGGVGTAYARFAFIDSDRDRHTDTIRFESKSGDRRFATDLAGYNPAADESFHRFVIDWQPDEVKAYFDGKLFATHKISIEEPLWVVGRNEYVNVLMDRFELARLGPKSGPPRAASSPNTRKGRVTRHRPDQVRYWYLQGLHYEAYQIEQMFPPGIVTVSEAWSDGMLPPLPPIRYEELIKYEAAIIANVDLTTLGPVGKRILRDYVRNGGGLLVLGGKGAYASGGWRGSIMEEMLPVRLDRDPWDIEELKAGELKRGAAHWITEGLSLSGKPRAEYVHKVAGVKSGAKVLLNAGDKPFLVLWEKDGGRVACILGTPYGSAKDNYFGAECWGELVKRALLWLGHRNERRER